MNLFQVILILSIPVYGFYGTIAGAINDHSGKLTIGLTCLFLTIFTVSNSLFQKKKNNKKELNKITVFHIISFLLVGIGDVSFAVGAILTLALNAAFCAMAISGVSLAMLSLIFSALGTRKNRKSLRSFQTNGDAPQRVAQANAETDESAEEGR